MRTHARLLRAPATPVLAVVAAWAVLVAGCGSYSPASAEAVLDDLEAAGELTCEERRSPVDGVVTCLSAEGDLTVGLTDDPARTVRNTRDTAGGPWIVGNGWVVISYDDDLDRVRRLRDAIGHGELFRDVDEVPVQVD